MKTLDLTVDKTDKSESQHFVRDNEGHATIDVLITLGAGRFFSRMIEKSNEVEIHIKTIIGSSILEYQEKYITNGLSAKSKACSFYEGKKKEFYGLIKQAGSSD